MTNAQAPKKDVQDKVVDGGKSNDNSLATKVHTELANIPLQAKHIDDAQHAKGTDAINQNLPKIQFVDSTKPVPVKDKAGLTAPSEHAPTINEWMKARSVNNMNDLPDLTQKGIRQGGLSDCHFVSAMEDIRSHGDEQKLKDMYKPDLEHGAKWVAPNSNDGDPKHEDPNGHYDKYVVNFPGYKDPIAVNWSEVHKDDGAFDSTAFPDVKQLDPSKTLPDGEKSRYPAILEVAAGKIFEKEGWGTVNRAGGVSDLDPAQNMNIALDGDSHIDRSKGLSDGATHSQELLTGRVSHARNIDDTSKFDNTQLQLLQKALDDGNLVSVRQSAPPEYAHQLSVVATRHDSQGSYVVVKNPQAQYDANKTLLGNDYAGYKTDETQGIMVPVVDFPKIFTRVDYQYTPSASDTAKSF